MHFQSHLRPSVHVSMLSIAHHNECAYPSCGISNCSHPCGDSLHSAHPNPLERAEHGGKVSEDELVHARALVLHDVILTTGVNHRALFVHGGYFRGDGGIAVSHKLVGKNF